VECRASKEVDVIKLELFNLLISAGHSWHVEISDVNGPDRA
jgi:hypothetical protein